MRTKLATSTNVVYDKEFISSLEFLFHHIHKKKWLQWENEINMRWPKIKDRKPLMENAPEVFGLAKIIKYHRKTGRWYKHPILAAEYDAITFSLVFRKLAGRLKPDALKTLVSRIESTAAQQHGFQPVRLEMDTYQLGLDRGFKVNPVDMQRQAKGQYQDKKTYDFDMNMDGESIAVECKDYSSDKTMPLKQTFAFELLNRVTPSVEYQLKKYGSKVFDICIAEDGTKIEDINKAISDCVAERKFQSNNFQLETSVLTTDFADKSIFKDENWFQKNKNIPDFRFGRVLHSYTIRHQSKVALIRIGHVKKFNRIELLKDALLKDSKSQLPHDKPTVLAVSLMGLDDAKITAAIDAETFRNAVITELFNRRHNLTALIFISKRHESAPFELWSEQPTRKYNLMVNANNKFSNTEIIRKLLLQNRSAKVS